MNKTFKLSLVTILTSAAMTANAGISIIDTNEGNFSVGGTLN